MELNTETITTPPMDSASVILLRDHAEGMQVLLLRRHQASNVLGGAHVFPGGKLDAADHSPLMLARLSQDADTLQQRLAEPALPAERAAALFVAAIREAFEECRVLLGQSDSETPDLQALQNALAEGQSWSEAFQHLSLQLRTDALVPWTRWITPRQASVTNKRFDTRFFITRVPDGQTAAHDNHETTETLWITPRQALIRYWDRQIELAPPQIMSLVQLARHAHSDSALAEAQSRRPPVIEPEPFDQDGIRTICYPGDPRHSVTQAAFPGPSRLMFKNKRFEPELGLAALLD
ncbi:NUDIX hydrolase [Limnohabitans sp. T6-5]|uniref:NUDIX hydrolase n=1 Tax=Limnohabitans sp. T6-5 TaxID=1100724 RepID=UPI000D34AB52|nr:NUDIX hydrolase [Limnohabitans sp. T6-5]PUE11126.1 NUDIX hydrolase [Limnohabitans sp. T6-5]